MKPSIIALILLILLLSCKTEENRRSSYSETAAEILELRKASNEAIRSGELEEISRFWVEDIMISTGAGTLLSGKEEVKSYLRGVYEKTPDIVFERLTEDIQENLNTQMAWEEGEWRGYRKSNPELILASGKYAAAWARVNGKWRIKSQLFVGL